MAGKININPDTVKGNLVLIIVVVATLGLLGYGWLQLGTTSETRATSAGALETNTKTYNEKKNYELPEDLGLTNSTGGRLEITTDETHENLALVKKAGMLMLFLTWCCTAKRPSYAILFFLWFLVKNSHLFS